MLRRSLRPRPSIALGALALCGALALPSAAAAAEDSALGRWIKPGPRPPERVDQRQQLPFPPPAGERARPAPAPVQPQAIPLRVVRHQPEGVEQKAHVISVTFNQPMVALDALDRVQTETPLHIAPAIPGRFRWQGARTLAFEPAGRIPYATRYRVTVPAGTRAASGQALAEDFAFTFATPRPRVIHFAPSHNSGEVARQPVLALTFAQQVDPAETARFVRLVAAGGEPVPLRAVPRADWPKDKRLAGYAGGEQQRRVLLLPRQPLALGTRYRLQVAAGLTSLEGPLELEKAQQVSFSTISPLRVTGLHCRSDEMGWNARRCDPAGAVELSFNHPLRVKKPARFFSVRPRVPGLELTVSYASVRFKGRFQAGRRYTFRVRPGLADTHGQQLQRGWSGRMRIVHLPPRMAIGAPDGPVLLGLHSGLKLPVWLRNLKRVEVAVYRVAEADIRDRLRLAGRADYDRFERELAAIADERVAAFDLPVRMRPDRYAARGVGLRRVVRRHGPGPYLVVLRAPGLSRDPYRARLVLISDIGLLARADSRQLVVAAHSIDSGRPLAGVELELQPAAGPGERARTGPDGLAVLRAAPRERALGGFLLLGRKGEDRCFVQLSGRSDDGSYAGLNWGRSERSAVIRTFLWADRDLYRPGETVHVFGVSRLLAADRSARPGPLPAGVDRLRWSAVSARNRELGQGEVAISRWGRFGFDLALPADVDLGRVRIATRLLDAPRSLGGAGRLVVDAQQYRAPEFTVDVALADAPLVRGGALDATVRGDYLHGAPMAGAAVDWNLYAREARFRPPDNPGFHFGSLVRPWHRHRRHHHKRIAHQPFPSRRRVGGGQGRLDARGRLAVHQPLALPRGLDPVALSLEATVADRNRQTVSGRAGALAHPAGRYVGIRSGRLLSTAGEPLRVELVLVDLEGRRLAGVPLRLEARRRKWTEQQVRDAEGHLNTEWSAETVVADRCRVRSGRRAVACTLQLEHGGEHTLVAVAEPEQGPRVESRAWLLVMGPERRRPRQQTEAQTLRLLPDRQRYDAGQQATVLVQAPFARGSALVSWSRDGLLGWKLLAVRDHSARLQLPVAADWTPAFFVEAAGVAERSGRGAERSPPLWAFGRKRVAVSRAAKTIRVQIQPDRRRARPGESVALDIALQDAAGAPLSGRVAVVAVDEAVLSLTDFATPDPLPFFYTPRAAGTVLKASLARLLAEWSRPEDDPPGAKSAKRGRRAPKMAEMAAAGPAAGGGAAGRTPVRSRFVTTPLVAEVTAGAGGRARVQLELPDNLTTFRIMAVAVDAAERFGSAEAPVTVRQPLMLRPALPRFVNYGDAFDAAVMVDAAGGAGGLVRVALEVEGARREAPAVKTAVLAPGRSAELRFRVRADSVGPARFLFSAAMDGARDAVEKTLTVWTPATSEAFASYGMLPRELDAADPARASLAQPVAPPAGALAGYGGLHIGLSSTALTGLRDAVAHLVDYPYECSEQTASRALPIFVLGPVLERFGLADVATEALRRELARSAVQRLVDGQCPDGGWNSFTCRHPSAPHLSAYVLFTLQQGRAAGFAVPAACLQRARRFLEGWLESGAFAAADADHAWRRRYRLDAAAQALYALTAGGDQAYPQHDERLYEQRAELDLFAQAMLAAVFHRRAPGGERAGALLRELGNRVVETPAGVHFAERRSEALRMLMHSSARSDAIALMVYLEVDPGADLVPKLARALMDGRIRGHWETTQADAYALVALSRYQARYEAGPTEMTARMWLGRGFLGQTAFADDSQHGVDLHIPMQHLAAAGPNDLILAKDGPGRLYYRIGLRYAPRDLDLAAREQGFAIRRRYAAIDHPGDVQGDAEQGWRVRAGATVRVELELIVPDRRYYAVVDDALPAGLELVNLGYATSAQDKRAGERGWAWSFNHRELRDARALHFADRLPAGIYHLRYLARATTPGDFIVPPAKAEEMYRPEVFGRTATQRMTIE